MTDRGPHPPDGTAACPFVAFDDDRDERSDRPDHRHRCYAEVEPAPRAIAHQEAYCLASAFPVCPTFQEWARREAARSRDERPITPAPATPASGGGQPASEWTERRGPVVHDEPPALPPRRNPPRDWAAPPPWASGAVVPGRSSDAGGDGDGPGGAAANSGSRPVPSEGRGLAGSAADRLARGESFAAPTESPSPQSRGDEMRSQGPDEGLATLVARRTALAAPVAQVTPGDRYDLDDDPDADETADEDAAPAWPARRRSVSSTRGAAAPSWEEPRRSEAYPTIKSRALDVGMPGLPGLPRIAVLAAALAIAALALFFLPALMGVGGDDPAASPTPAPTTAVVTPSPEPTEPPAPTPQVYVIRSGDTLSKVARSFGVSLDDLLEANRDRITNPDRISIGDEIIIPVTAPGSEVAPEP
jgi:LysM repeat protein